ncbi:hypothetical protein TSOC_005273 [Tetrabaena socialis]|uniref:Uncharacterized protein n=1 Tax=Tetrabaena socialis TaxID=47790 RepID=A0A2J8A6M3_9CHLO|nr:hypothetical protein TSOC_005273 [Tetrabaena socialis]|eukprot:PNH08182.1 hypothetical protein TSOC_005273 [Tetrabaena socialis]
MEPEALHASGTPLRLKQGSKTASGGIPSTHQHPQLSVVRRPEPGAEEQHGSQGHQQAHEGHGAQLGRQCGGKGAGGPRHSDLSGTLCQEQRGVQREENGLLAWSRFIHKSDSWKAAEKANTATLQRGGPQYEHVEEDEAPEGWQRLSMT